VLLESLRIDERFWKESSVPEAVRKTGRFAVTLSTSGNAFQMWYQSGFGTKSNDKLRLQGEIIPHGENSCVVIASCSRLLFAPGREMRIFLAIAVAVVAVWSWLGSPKAALGWVAFVSTGWLFTKISDHVSVRESDPAVAHLISLLYGAVERVAEQAPSAS
jgi:hypothetical protein